VRDTRDGGAHPRATDALKRRAHALIDRLSHGSRDDGARDALLCDLLAHQAERVEPYARLLRARRVDVSSARHPGAFPALPTDVFRYARVAVHPPDEDQRVFRTSGTTSGARGAHCRRDLSLYQRAARAAAGHALFHDVERMRLILLTASESEAPDSSLSFMLSRFVEWFGAEPTTWAWHDGALDADRLAHALDRAQADGASVALLGTSFAFVHADDALGDRAWNLPSGSRIMQTGGYKGRSRQVDPEDMRGMLRSRYGVPEPAVVAEYGMTELSSQMYETTLRAPTEPRRLWVPGWMRATPVDPETLAPLRQGETGILRLDDVANVDGACAIQTSDLARQVDGGIELLGRAEDAIARGCSLAVEEALGGSR